jgi:hypothetical protein
MFLLAPSAEPFNLRCNSREGPILPLQQVTDDFHLASRKSLGQFLMIQPKDIGLVD